MPLRGYEAGGLISSNPQTLEDLAKSDCVTTVAQLKSRGLAGDVIDAIQLLLCDFLDNMNLRSSMNNNQISLAARLMVEKHHHLPFPQAFKMFFEDAMCGKFGPHFGRMDIQTLMIWLQQFENSYFDMVDEQAYAEHTSTKGDKGVDLMAIIKSKEQGEEVVEMPDSIKKQLHIKREETLADKIRAKVIKENSHLFSTLSFEDAQKQITNLINDELKKNNLTNQN